MLNRCFINAINRKLFQEFVWLIFGQIISLALGLVFVKILTKVGPADFGIYNLILTVVNLFSTIFYGPFDQSFLRKYYIYKKNFKENSLIIVYFQYLILISLFIFIGNIIFVSYFVDEINIINTCNVLAISFYVVFTIINNMFNSILNMLRKRKLNVGFLIFERVSFLILLIVLCQNNILNLNNFYFGTSFILALIFLIKLFVILKDHKIIIFEIFSISKRFNWEIFLEMLIFAYPFILWGITSWLQSNSERWFILRYLSVKDVGLYSLMLSISNYLITIPGGLVNQLIQPVIFQKLSSVDSKENFEGMKLYKINIYISMIMLIIGVFVTYIFSKPIISIISNNEFLDFNYILPYICLSTGLFLIAQNMTMFGVIIECPNIYILPKMLIGLVSVILNFILIKKFYLVGIIYSLLITNLFFILSIYFTNKRFKYRLNENFTHS